MILFFALLVVLGLMPFMVIIEFEGNNNFELLLLLELLHQLQQQQQQQQCEEAMETTASRVLKAEGGARQSPLFYPAWWGPKEKLWTLDIHRM